MCCFIAPLTQAIVTTAVRRYQKKTQKVDVNTPWNRQLPKLELMLWGGSAMLVLDHIINGEVTWQYPFFTALANEGGAFTMMNEILSVGLPMCVLITLIYGLMVLRDFKTIQTP